MLLHLLNKLLITYFLQINSNRGFTKYIINKILQRLDLGNLITSLKDI